jgi:hypothetical protein
MSAEHKKTTLNPLFPTVGIELPGLARRAAISATPDAVIASKPSGSAPGGLVRRRRQYITCMTNGSNLCKRKKQFA